MIKVFVARLRFGLNSPGSTTRFGAIGVSLSLVLCGCTATQTNVEGSPVTVESLHSEITTLSSNELTLIAHRGAWRVFPEGSTESFDAVAQTKFPIEFDLRRLSDGTLVPSHDATADRSMEGLTGPLEAISSEQWHKASIRSQNGKSFGTPTTWDAILERYGGSSVLVPELKRPVIDLTGFVRTIVDRGLQDSIIVQSRDYETCKELAAAGIKSALVLLEGRPTPAAIKEDGIQYVAVSRDYPPEYFRELKASGLAVWVFTLNKATSLEEFLDLGVEAVFTDDPWKLEQELAEIGRPISLGQ